MKNTRIYDRVPVKDVRVKDPQIGTRTPQILISRKGGEYLRGDVLDANATTELAKSIHMPDIDKINDKLEQTVNKDQIGQPNGVASLDDNGNIPTSQLRNVDVDIFMIVNELPTENIKNNKIYCVKDTESTDDNNTYIEYAYINEAWEKVGEFQAEPDLSGYAKLNKDNIFSGNITSPIVTAKDRIQINQLTKYNNRYLVVQNPTDRGNNIVFATDGSIADLDTKANTSDVLLKKSASGGYYIEENSNELGQGAFAVNSECTASGVYSHAEGISTASGNGAHAESGATASGVEAHAECYATASGNYSHAEGTATASGNYSHAEGSLTKAIGGSSHAEGLNTEANGAKSHAEGESTYASGYCSHAQGVYNVDDKNAIYSVGIGSSKTTRKNAEYIYTKNNESGHGLTDDPKNGYKYLIGVGGYDGISTDNTTYKSVQEVIADLTARIEQLETKVRAIEAANTHA